LTKEKSPPFTLNTCHLKKLKAATQNEQNDGWLIVKNRPISDIHLFSINDWLILKSGHSASRKELCGYVSKVE